MEHPRYTLFLNGQLGYSKYGGPKNVGDPGTCPSCPSLNPLVGVLQELPLYHTFYSLDETTENLGEWVDFGITVVQRGRGRGRIH